MNKMFFETTDFSFKPSSLLIGGNGPKQFPKFRFGMHTSEGDVVK